MKEFSDIQENIFMNTPAAVNRKTGVLYINPNYFNGLTNASKNFVIAHEYGHLINNSSNEKNADDYALWKQIGLGNDSIDVLKSFYDAMPFTTDEQVERGEKLLRTVFFNEFKKGNDSAKAFLNIIEAEPMKLDAANGFLAKGFGNIVSTVGGVLELIPAVGQVVGTAVAAAGAAISAGGSLAEAKAAGEDAYAKAKDQLGLQIDKQNENLALDAVETSLDAQINAAKATNQANEYIEKQKKNKSKRKLLVCVAIVLVIVTGGLLIINK